MIIIDEQLQGEGLEELIGKWYPGSVVSMTTLRPNTIIKDEAIPGLLAQQNLPTFVTINVTDFWQKLPLSEEILLRLLCVGEYGDSANSLCRSNRRRR